MVRLILNFRRGLAIRQGATIPGLGSSGGSRNQNLRFDDRLLGELSVTHALNPNEKRLAFIGVLIALFLFALNQTIVAAALPRIVSDLKGFELYPWAYTAFSLTSTISIPVWGSLSDHRGRRSIFLLGVVLFGAAGFLTGWAGSMIQLIVLRALQGLGGGALMCMAFATIADIFTPLERGKYQGFNSTVFAVASLLGPLIGGYLTDHLGWRYIFWVTAPLALVAYYFLYRYLPAARPRDGGTLDRAGILLLTLALLPLLVALSLISTKSPSYGPALALIVCSVISVILFLLWEMRAPFPIIDPRFLTNQTLRTANFSSFLTSTGLFGGIIYLPLFIQGVRGASATGSGLVLTPLVLGMTGSSAIAGLLVSRTGRYKPFILGGLALMTVALAALSMNLAEVPLWTIVLVSILLGLGVGPTNSLYVIAVQSEAPRHRIGSVTATNQFFRQMGGTVGVALFGTVLSLSFQRGLELDLPKELSRLPQSTLQRMTSPEVITDSKELSWAEGTLRDLSLAELKPTVIDVLRVHLASGIRAVFFCATLLTALALLLTSRLPNRDLKSLDVPASSAEAVI